MKSLHSAIRKTAPFLLPVAMGSWVMFADMHTGAQPAFPRRVAPSSLEDNRAAPARQLEFDVASVHLSDPSEPSFIGWGLPDSYRARNYGIFPTIFLAFFSPEQWMSGATASERIVGAPTWTRSEHYDIEAKVGPENLAAWKVQGRNKPLLNAMLQSFLAERCKLVAHRTMVETSVYALVAAPRGQIGLTPTRPDEGPPSGGVELFQDLWIVSPPKGTGDPVKLVGASMASFASLLSQTAARPVVDRTGLKGKYDFALPRKDTSGRSPSDAADPFGPWDLKRVGLRLISTRAPIDVIVIDHIARPSLEP